MVKVNSFESVLLSNVLCNADSLVHPPQNIRLQHVLVGLQHYSSSCTFGSDWGLVQPDESAVLREEKHQHLADVAHILLVRRVIKRRPISVHIPDCRVEQENVWVEFSVYVAHKPQDDWIVGPGDKVEADMELSLAILPHFSVRGVVLKLLQNTPFEQCVVHYSSGTLNICTI